MNKLSSTQIAKIHVAKKQLGLSDDEYRSILSSFNVKSSKDLKQSQWLELENYFIKLGFQPKQSPKYTKNNRDRCLHKIQSILDQYKLPTNYLNGISQRMFKKDIGQCNPKELQSVLISLIKYSKKREETS